MKCIECNKNALVVYHGFSFCKKHLQKYINDIKPKTRVNPDPRLTEYMPIR